MNMRAHARRLKRLTYLKRWASVIKLRNGRRVLIMWNMNGVFTRGRAWS